MANDKDFIVKNAVEVGGSTKVTLGTITSSDIDLSTGNYFSDTLAANTTYTISNAGDVQSFQVEVTGGLGSGYDISAADYTGKSFSVASQLTAPHGLFFKPDGTVMFLVGLNSDTVYQYSLSTAWDLSTASYASKSLSVTSQEAAPRGVSFKSDGTKMYIVGSSNNTVYQYSLSTAWDVSTGSYDSVSFSVSTQVSTAVDILFKPDGTKMYIVDDLANDLEEYSLSTAWDISTASYNSASLSFGSQDANPGAASFNDDGTVLLMVGSGNDAVYQYDLSTAYDISTGSYANVSFTLNADALAIIPEALFFKSDGSSFFVADRNTDVVYEYSSATTATLTWPSSIEWAGGVAPAAPAVGETDVFTISTDDGGTSYVGVKTADNLS